MFWIYIYVALGIAASEKQDRASGFYDLFIQFNDYALMFNVNVKLIILTHTFTRLYLNWANFLLQYMIISTSDGRSCSKICSEDF